MRRRAAPQPRPRPRLDRQRRALSPALRRKPRRGRRVQARRVDDVRIARSSRGRQRPQVPAGGRFGCGYRSCVDPGLAVCSPRPWRCWPPRPGPRRRPALAPARRGSSTTSPGSAIRRRSRSASPRWLGECEGAMVAAYARHATAAATGTRSRSQGRRPLRAARGDVARRRSGQRSSEALPGPGRRPGRRGPGVGAATLVRSCEGARTPALTVPVVVDPLTARSGRSPAWPLAETPASRSPTGSFCPCARSTTTSRACTPSSECPGASTSRARSTRPTSTRRTPTEGAAVAGQRERCQRPTTPS